MVTASNLAEFREHALAVLGGINRNLVTDEDFADADSTVKWCKTVEDKLESAKAGVLTQMADVDTVCRTIDDIAAETRRVRLELDRLVKAEKDRRKSEIVAAGVDAVRAHYASINATLGEHAILAPQTLTLDIGGAIKNLRTLSSIKDAVDSAVANAQIAASQRADGVRASVTAYTDAAKDHYFLFPDAVALCGQKSADDLRNLVATRIAEHKSREEARAAAEHTVQQNTTRAVEAEQQSSAVGGGMDDSTGALRAAGEPGMVIAKPPTSSARVKLGELNARIAPLSITADGLAQLGFRSVGNERAAKLYAESDWPAICNALSALIARAANAKVAA